MARMIFWMIIIVLITIFWLFDVYQKKQAKKEHTSTHEEREILNPLKRKDENINSNQSN